MAPPRAVRAPSAQAGIAAGGHSSMAPPRAVRAPSAQAGTAAWHRCGRCAHRRRRRAQQHGTA
eukprot:63796-Chlamydomonas_euryale.AAC.1